MESQVCSICLELVDVQQNIGRAIARLACNHVYHLDCIGSNFNYRGGEMTCPLCRHEENGEWLYNQRHQQEQEHQEEEEVERERERDQEYDILQTLLEFIYEVFSNQQPERLQQLIRDINSNIEDPRGHFHIVMPSGHYWCPNDGFRLHPPPLTFSRPLPPLPIRRTRRFGHARNYRNQFLRTFGPERQLNDEHVIRTQSSWRYTRPAPYRVREQPSQQNCSRPISSSHQQSHLSSVFQRQAPGSCPFLS